MTKEDFQQKLKDLKLSLTDFAKLINTPYTTVQNWTRENHTPPNWLDSWFDNYEKAKSFESVKDEVIKLAKLFDKK